MILAVIHILISAALIGLILLQQRSSGFSGSIFGGGADGGGFYHARRGMERIIFAGTIILAIAFVGLAVFQIISG